MYADPHLLQDPRAAADELCDALQINRRRARRVVEDALVKGKSEKKWFAYVARKVDPELAKAALALDLPGVGSYTEEERTYPLKAAAAQVLGFAGMENTGLAGMELFFDKELSGEAGSETIVRDPAGHALKTVAHQRARSRARTCASPSTARSSTTRRTCSRRRCATPAASRPSRSSWTRAPARCSPWPTSPSEGFHGFGKGDQAAEKNRAVTDVYEPGSIFKLVTISGALADGIVTPDTTFTLPPSMPGGRPRDPRVARTPRDRHVLASARSCSGRATSAP